MPWWRTCLRPNSPVHLPHQVLKLLLTAVLQRGRFSATDGTGIICVRSVPLHHDQQPTGSALSVILCVLVRMVQEVYLVRSIGRHLNLEKHYHLPQLPSITHFTPSSCVDRNTTAL
jgi:hypothetical protein